MLKKQSFIFPPKRIIDFANDRIELTDVEAKHFDHCPICKSALHDAIRVPELELMTKPKIDVPGGST